MQKLEIREGNKRTGHSSNSRFSPSACDAKNYDTSLDNVYNGHGFANTPIYAHENEQCQMKRKPTTMFSPKPREKAFQVLSAHPPGSS